MDLPFERGLDAISEGLLAAMADKAGQWLLVIDMSRGVMQTRQYSRKAVAGLLACALAGVATQVSAAPDLRVVEAARQGNFAEMTAVLRRNNANARWGDGSTALLWAIHHVNRDAVRALIRVGANLNAANRYGVTPLLQACRVGDAEILQAVFDAGAKTRTTYPNNETALMACAYSGSLGAVERLIADGADVNARESTENQTALMMAADQGHVEVVRALLAAGARHELAARSSDLIEVLPEMGGGIKMDWPRGGFTALMFAAREGRAEVVKTLIGAGADPTQKTPNGMTAMLLAITNSRLDVANYILEHGGDPNDGSMVALIELHNAYEQDEANNHVRTRPWYADSVTPIELIVGCLDRGADPTRPSNFTASHYGANRVTKTVAPAYVAALGALNADVLKLFFDRGLVDPNVVPKFDLAPAVPGFTGMSEPRPPEASPFLIATSVRRGGGGGGAHGSYRYKGTRGFEQVAQLLAEKGADINAANPTTGMRPLHVAAANNDLAAIKVLVARGAALDAKDVKGYTPLDYAMGKRAVAPALVRGEAAPPPRVHREATALLRQLAGSPPDEPANARTESRSNVGQARAAVSSRAAVSEQVEVE